jgi:hypothetical protein
MSEFAYQTDFPSGQIQSVIRTVMTGQIQTNEKQTAKDLLGIISYGAYVTIGDVDSSEAPEGSESIPAPNAFHAMMASQPVPNTLDNTAAVAKLKGVLAANEAAESGTEAPGQFGAPAVNKADWKSILAWAIPVFLKILAGLA